jgi:fatty acid desaturase
MMLPARTIAAVALGIVLNLYVAFGLPLLLRSDPTWALTLMPVSALSYSMYALIHEAIHGNLGSRKANERLGRLLSILFGSSFAFLQTSHLLHHKYNRKLGRPDVYRADQESKWSAALRYYSELMGGLYVQEVIAPAIFLLPRPVLATLARRDAEPGFFRLVHERIVRRCLLGQMRFDAVCIVAVWATSIALYGPSRWALLAAFAGRAFVVSALDNVYHYRTEVENVTFGMNLRLPRLASLLLLHFNYHGVHHARPNLPWHALPAEFDGRPLDWDGSFGSALFEQFEGPVELQDLGRTRSRMPRLRYQAADAASPASTETVGE